MALQRPIIKPAATLNKLCCATAEQRAQHKGEEADIFQSLALQESHVKSQKEQAAVTPTVQPVMPQTNKA